jgi:ABC-type amino acid transport substrate-binding protein
VGVVIEDYTAQFLEDHQLNAILVPYADYESLVLGAINHDVDAFIMEAPVALNYLAKHDGLKTVHRVEKPLYTKGFLAGVKDGSDELVQQINKGISAISSEELALIVRNWTGLPESHSNKIRQVTVVTSDDHIPYYYMDEQQEMTGMLIDIWRLWSKKTGIDVKFSGLSFSDSLATVRDGAAEIHGGWFYSEQRDTYLDYAAFLTKSKTHFFFHESVYGVKNIEDLIGFKIGVMAQDFAIEYIRQKKAFYAAVREGDSDTLAVIKNGMEAITPQERAAIERRWTGGSSINTQDTLIVAMPVDQAPFSMLNSEGNPAGLFADLWQLWARTTGEKIELRGYQWQDGFTAVRNGDADIHAGLSKMSANTESLEFATPVYEFPVHLFFHSNR